MRQLFLFVLLLGTLVLGACSSSTLTAPEDGSRVPALQDGVDPNSNNGKP